MASTGFYEEVSRGKSTPLTKAVQAGSLKEVKDLIKKSHNVNEADFFGQTPLHYAAELGHEAIAKLIIQSGADVHSTHATNKNGLSALHGAACKGHTAVAKLLINAGSPINAADINGTSVVHCAVTNGHADIVDLLLKAKVNINVQDRVKKRTPLFLACATNNAKMVEKLLKYGSKINLQDAYGMSPLCALSLYNNTHLASLLISHSAKVNLCDVRQNTPLHYAARHGNRDLMTSLIQRGSVLDAENGHGETPLHLAVRTCHTDTAAILLQNGSNPNVTTSNSADTPLLLAVKCYSEPSDFEELLLLMINSGLNMNYVENDSIMSALYQSLNLGKFSHSLILLQHGASPNIDCPFNLTILHKACQKGEREVVSCLLHTEVEWARETWLHGDIHTSGVNPKLLDGYEENIPMVLLKHLDIYSLIQYALANPHSLTHLSRRVVRQLLGSKKQTNLEKLGLPKRLRDFVMLKIL